MAKNGTQELWQAFSEDGFPIPGVGLTREQAKDGDLHAAAHLWIWRYAANEPEILLQLRSAQTRTWPGHWDISAAGHVDIDEEPAYTAQRELYEELGLKAVIDDIDMLFVHRQHLLVPDSEIIENEFQFVYGYVLQDQAKFTHEDGEVSEVRWFSITELRVLIAENVEGEKIVAHGSEYFTKLLQAIEAKKP